MKVGSSSLTDGDGGLSTAALDLLVEQLAQLQQEGGEPVLVSSGAIAAGRAAVGEPARGGPDLERLQALAAVGQGLLMSAYTRCCQRRSLLAAQVLLTAADFGDRAAYLNARGTLQRLLRWRVLPIINENDTIATDEITFGENDRLAALVAGLVHADLLLILTDTEGVYSTDPRLSEQASLIEEVSSLDASLEAAGNSRPGSVVGSGGMASKIAAARIAAWSGIPCVIAAASRPDVVARAVAGEPVGTRVLPRPRRMAARKLWIAFAQPARGRLQVDDGAVEAIRRRGRSLLPVGVRAIHGAFAEGDAVEIRDRSGELVAKGLAACSAERLRSLVGDGAVVAPAQHDEAVHRDDLVVLSA